LDRPDKLRPLAVTTLSRSNALSGIPSVSEFVPGYEASSWFGIAAPRGTPVEIIQILNRETNAGLADPRIEARLTDMGGMLLTGSPADFGMLIASETEKWGQVIKLAGIKAE
jgi:tripartite-type tricarboxylate transporter receptor subunit TctC